MPVYVAPLNAASGQTTTVGPLRATLHVLAEGRVRHQGEPVALIAAETLEQARAAMEAIDVEYEPIPGVFDAAAALLPDAPQVHESLRIFIAGMQEEPESDDEDPAIIPVPFVNPEITPLGNEKEVDWEGCLSIPDIRGKVPRYARVRIRGLDREGSRRELQLAGFPARVVQHEVDHLDGVLYPMRIRDMTRFGFQDVLFPGQEPADD